MLEIILDAHLITCKLSVLQKHQTTYLWPVGVQHSTGRNTRIGTERITKLHKEMPAERLQSNNFAVYTSDITQTPSHAHFILFTSKLIKFAFWTSFFSVILNDKVKKSNLLFKSFINWICPSMIFTANPSMMDPESLQRDSDLWSVPRPPQLLSMWRNWESN